MENPEGCAPPTAPPRRPTEGIATVVRARGFCRKPDATLRTAPDRDTTKSICRRRGRRFRLEGLMSVSKPIDWARVLYHRQTARLSVNAKGRERVGQAPATASAKEKGLLRRASPPQRTCCKVDGERRYRTLGELAFQVGSVHMAKAKQSGAYSRGFDRNLLLDEIKTLFDAQPNLATLTQQLDLSYMCVTHSCTRCLAITGKAFARKGRTLHT